MSLSYLSNPDEKDKPIITQFLKDLIINIYRRQGNKNKTLNQMTSDEIIDQTFSHYIKQVPYFSCFLGQEIISNKNKDKDYKPLYYKFKSMFQTNNCLVETDFNDNKECPTEEQYFAYLDNNFGKNDPVDDLIFSLYDELELIFRRLKNLRRSDPKTYHFKEIFKNLPIYLEFKEKNKNLNLKTKI